MAAARNKKNIHLPPGTRVRDGYYSYMCPLSRKEFGLGRNLIEAIAQVRELQATLTETPSVIGEIRPDMSTDAVLPYEEIVSKAIPLAMHCGVYFLVSGNEIVYVGSSINCSSRVNEHRAEAVKAFDSWSFVATSAADRTLVEATYFTLFRPRYNRCMPGHRQKKGGEPSGDKTDEFISY